MHPRSVIGAIVLAALAMPVGPAGAVDQYPDWKGQWSRFIVRGVAGQASHDQTRPGGYGQQAPLTPQYQAVLEESLADQANGGLGNFPTSRCFPAGMPHMMMGFGPQEYVITPEATYILINWDDHARRIFTDGRDWPKDVEPSFLGYSIGRWIDEKGDGRFNVLEVETRNFKGPRSLDPAGMPVHADNQSIVKERIVFDWSKPDTLRNDITLIDNAYTRPWTVSKTYRRVTNEHPEWLEYNCAGDNELIKLGEETYYRGGDGLLMPTRKDQPPPDLRYFKQTRK